MSPKKILWPLEPHSAGKHRVLRQYLHAWLPILGTWSGRIIFIDGFAGPGEYATGEEGSPVIALKALLDHTAKNKITAEVIFVFIEADPDRTEHLKKVLAPLLEELPENVKVEVTCGQCAPTLNETLDELDSAGDRLAPALVMLDPFGVKDTPMEVVARLLRQARCELFISFMWEWVNRFQSTPEFEQHLDSLFGTRDWRSALEIDSTEERKRFLHTLYEQQLRKAGAKFVTYFELWNEGRHVYSIFFATKHSTGFDKIKEAIWRADRTGNYQFRGRRGEQMALLLEDVDLRPFQQQMAVQFNERGWVSIEEVLAWAKTDSTSFFSGQVKRALKPMEKGGELEVDPASRNKTGTYPNGTQMRFKPLS